MAALQAAFLNAGSGELFIHHALGHHHEPWLRAMIGQSIAIHSYRDGQVELRVNGVTVQYTILQSPKRSSPILVDEKSLHHSVDELTAARRRTRPCRENQPQNAVSTGVMAAKKMSAQKRASSR